MAAIPEPYPLETGVSDIMYFPNYTRINIETVRKKRRTQVTVAPNACTCIVFFLLFFDPTNVALFQ